MKFGKSVGLGALCWVPMAVLMGAFVAFNVTDSAALNIIAAIIGALVAYWLAGYLGPATHSIALVYGAVFVVVGLILDMVITAPLIMGGDKGFFSMPIFWIGYALVLFAPLLQVKKSSV